MAELGCFASTPTFSRTMPFACDDPPVGEVLKTLPRARFLYDLSAYKQNVRSEVPSVDGEICTQRFSRRSLRSLRAA